ncbi:elongation factor P [Alphaproteobacteria bacterium]|nr:elongation factor P [Alphaproteobacteria bacterium]GHS95835.1 elongation factor P [Alphaproteobacteria bacterium]
MKIGINEMRVGNIVEYQDKLWVVVKTLHVQPGKGGAYTQAELKGVLDGTKLNERFRSAEEIERVFLDEKAHQYLYAEGDTLVFMDVDTFDQIYLDQDVLGDSVRFLQDGMLVTLSFYEGIVLSAELPATVVATVEQADPVVKGQTASASYKPAVLDNGLRILVPQHIDSGMKIVVNTSDGSYVERAKD